MQIHPRWFYITVATGALVVASMYGYVWYDGYSKAQYAKAVDALPQNDVVMDVKDGVVTVRPASK